MNPAEFRATLARLDLDQSGFARVLHALGHGGRVLHTLRRVQAWALGESPVPGPVIALLALMERAPGAWREAA